MIEKLRVRAQSESGFTLVELLVVMLIIGLLAAIAIPAFFNQRNKANDASAKEAVRTMQTAMETYSTDNSGSYTGANLTKLNAIESTIPATACAATPVGPCPLQPTITLTGSTGTGYTVSWVAKTTNNTYQITRSDTGVLSYPCKRTAAANDAGGCVFAASTDTTGTWN
jgi:type IV pilus assembly protein PilA